ncbi:MAG: outer membrane protein assembly factor BamD [Oleiphilaceae bacterium]|jgi:outer membrane protein assembly factor BamD
MRLISLISVIIIVCINLSACGTAPKNNPSEQKLYDDAKKAIKLRNFSQATIALEELEASFPFGKYAEQAQLDLIYARFSGLDLEGAILACDRFIRLHPQSPSVDYAYYTRGIANYSLDIGISSQYFTMVDNSSRDPGHMRLAFKDFSELLNRFPRSTYASDAQQRMLLVRNNLAQYELHAARYYIKREAFIAAANRAAHVVKNFPNTPAIEDALIMMVELYNELDLPSQEADALAVLKANYAEGKAFDEAQIFVPQNKLKQNRSLLSVISFGLFE